jgi:spore coat polysaccharide biosynthesis protein SpsF
MKRVGFIITGRMKSTRLKEKLTLKIQEREIIAWMIDRAKLIFDPKDIVIATSTNPQDDVLREIAEREGISVFKGDEEDVIERLYYAAKEYDFDFFINITADCPLFGFDYIQSIVDLAEKTKADLVTSLELPHGIFTYGMKTDSIERIMQIKKTNQTEVWGDYFYSNPDLFRVEKLLVSDDEKREGYRLTLDYPEDFTFFEAVYTHFGKDTFKKSSHDIIAFLDKNPEIVAINAHCKQNYEKRWNEQRATKVEGKE